MAGYHLLPTQEVEQMLGRWPPELRDIAQELRSLIVTAAPGATETPHRHKGLTYYFAERGGPVSASLCQIIRQPDHVRLAFVHGAFLPDPQHLLEGETKYKRYVRLYRYERVPWEALAELIRQAARFDPYTLTFR